MFLNAHSYSGNITTSSCADSRRHVFPPLLDDLLRSSQLHISDSVWLHEPQLPDAYLLFTQ